MMLRRKLYGLVCASTHPVGQTNVNGFSNLAVESQ